MLMGTFYLCIATYIIDLLMRAHLKLATGLSCHCRLFLVFFASYCLISLHSSQPSLLMTGVEDTY